MNNHNTYNLTKPFKKGLNRTIIFLIVSMMGIGNAWADTWDGTITNNANNKFAENGITLQNPAQANSESNPYTIDNAKEFAYFMSIVKNKWTGYTSGYYWKLTTDIDLANLEWTYGSNTGNSFQGHFDGDSHTVKNVSLPVTTNSNYGLFPTIQGANATTLAEVKNLKINGVTFTSAASRANTTRLGSLAGYVKQAKVSDIAISNVKFIYTGGITNENDLGGAIGCAEATVSLESVSVSSVSADFTGTTTNLYVAGLVGKINSLTSVNKCSTKDITITYNTIANASRISGLIGYTKGAANAPISINGCSAVNTKINLKAGINNGSYIGTLVAQTADNTQIGDGTDANKNIVTSPDINIGGDIMAASYIGGAIGDFAGATDATKTSVVKKLTVTSPKIKVNNYSAGTSLTGGVFGRVSTFTAIDGVNLTGTTFSFTKDLTVAQQIGTFAGTITGNATQQISVKNVTIDKSELTFGTDKNSNTLGLNAGVIGKVSSNVYLDSWKLIGNSNIIVNGDLNKSVIGSNGKETASDVRLGGFIGYTTSAADAPIKIENIEIGGNSSIKITNHIAVKGAQLGGLLGYAELGNAANNQASMNKLEVKGTTSISVGGDISTTSYLGGFAGYIVGRALTDCYIKIDNVTLGISNITANGEVKAGSYFGGLLGRAVTACTLNDCKITTAANLIFSNDIAAVSYIGGAIGDFAGANGYTSYIKALTVKSPTISIKNYSAGTSLTGGVFGRVYTFTEVDGVTLTGASMTFTNDLSVAQQIGTFAGIINGNATQQISVKNITIDNSELTFGTSATSSTIGIKAGIIGQVNSNVLLDSWKITGSSNIKVNGNLITKNNFIGGLVGYMASEANAPMGLTNIKIAGNSTVSVSGDVTVGSYLSGLIGYSGTTSDVAYNKTTISDVEISGKTSVVVSGNLSGVSYIGGFAGYVVGRAKADCLTEIKNITLAASSISVGDLSTANNYIGALVGRANTSCSISNWKIQSQANITIGGNVTATCHVGGAFGSLEGTANYPLTASDIEVKGLDIVLNGNLKNTLYVGGIAGQLSAVATTPNKIEKCSVIGKIHTVGTHTFNESMLYAFGGIVGYTAQSATNVSEVSQCISNVDFNLSGLTPVTKINLYCNGFVVGGIIGRMNTPSRLPEHLYYTGKIYAPYATVAPIVGVFCTNMYKEAYIYNDYSGENATYISAEEWQKANTWYFTDYKLGLSPEVMTQNARTRNYSATPTVEDGINYLLVDDKTFAEYNKIGSAIKKSFTVLAYTQDNKDVDHGIYPQWNKNKSDYPTYYMYYMQGLNRGVFTPKDESDFARLLMDKKLNFMPQMIHSGDAGHGYEFIVDAGRLEDDNDFTITYQWYRSDKTTPLQGETSKILSIGKTDLDAVGGTIYCVVTVSGSDCRAQRTLMGTAATVVFVDGKNGIDNAKGSRERGWTPNTAVKTIDNANLLLDGGSWDNNIIVIMGTLNPNSSEHNKNTYVPFQSRGSNPATLTGKWGNTDYGGRIILAQWNPNNKTDEDTKQGAEENEVNPVHSSTIKRGSNCYVLHDTKFENLTFEANGRNDNEGGGNNFIECHGNDVTFGKGLVMTGFQKLSKAHGNFNNAEVIPELTVILTATNLSETDIETYTKNRTKPQVVTFQSGRYGRLMGGRYTNGFFAKDTNTSHCILGSAENLIWAVVNIEIDSENPTAGIVYANGKDENQSITWDGKYTCDINSVIAGLTDGSMYGDYTINFHGGSVSYIVGGNQGNPVANGTLSFKPDGGTNGAWGQWPNATYFGRTVINVEQKDGCKEINVGNLYTGGLGREANGNSAKSIVDMYYYGHTEVNVKSGTVGNVYAGGAGGVMGVNPWDAHLPYATSTNGTVEANAIINNVQYGDKRYGTWSNMVKGTSPMAKVKLHNLNDAGNGYDVVELDLSNSYTTVNISGGIINGNVYGGGYGFVQDMPDKVTMQGVGSVFGTANINITGGNISGSVYGGSQGHSQFYKTQNKYGQKITHIAEMIGSVNINISGTESKYPTIGGAIYGGGQGLVSNEKNEYLRIATAGNYDLAGQNATEEQKKMYKTDINITIDMPEDIEFHNDIYGGGALGMVDGTTNIVLKHGNFTGNIYGGGYGEKDHLGKAMVNGDITISTGDANPANVDRGLPVMVNNTIYGGGNMAQVTGNTFVNIHHGNIIGNVFGGGKGLTSSESGTETSYGKVTGNTHVLFFNTTKNNNIIGNIYGGGALGDVKGNTEVKIKDGIIKGNVFGAGKGEEGHPDKAKVTGNTNVIVEDKK